MINVIAKHYVKEDKVADFIENAKKLQEETLKEEGCIKYGLFQDVKDPGILTMIEEWKNNEALDKHMASEHFSNIVPILRGFDEKPTEINLYRKVL